MDATPPRSGRWSCRHAIKLFRECGLPCASKNLLKFEGPAETAFRRLSRAGSAIIAAAGGLHRVLCRVAGEACRWRRLQLESRTASRLSALLDCRLAGPVPGTPPQDPRDLVHDDHGGVFFRAGNNRQIS